MNVTIEHLTGDDVVAHPVFSPIDQHEFKNNSETVTISCPTPDAKIYYTTSRDENAQFEEYTAPISISETTFFRAYCEKDGHKGGEDTCKIVSNPNHFKIPTKGEYDQFTYTWTDAAGTQHPDTKVTETATSADQIMALLYAIYTNKDIPGQIYMNKSEPVSYARYTRNINREFKTGWVTRTATAWNKYWPNYDKIGGTTVGIPVLPEDPVEGYTTLLVKVRPDFNIDDFNLSDNDFQPKAGYSYKHGNGAADGSSYSIAVMPGTNVTYAGNPVYKMISEAFESVEMLYGKRLEDDTKGFGDDDMHYNPGTIYTFDIEASRFFMISKGSACWGGRYPLAGLFEEFAPKASDRLDVYGTLIDGQVYFGTHACPSVPYMGHDFYMDSEYNTYQLKNMTFFIPDYRLKYWEQNSTDTKWTSSVKDFDKSRDLSGTQGINWYHPMFMPETYMYSIKLHIKDGDPVASGNEHEFIVHPNWVTSLDNVEETELQEEFYIYLVDEDGNVSAEPLNSEPLVDIQEFAHVVPQHEHSYEITYVVKGKPIGINIDYVWSNRVTIRIPGYKEDEYILLENKGYQSTFDHDAHKNIYCNYPMIVNDPDKPVLAKQLIKGDKMRIYRLDALKEELFKVATIEITDKGTPTDAETEDGTRTVFWYKINMNEASQWDNDSKLYPDKEGTFESPNGGGGGVIDFGGLYIADQFSESTINNSHQPRFYYQLLLVREATEEADLQDIISNMISVPVRKTEFEVNDLPYSQEQVDADTDRSIVLNTAVGLNVQLRDDDKNIVDYVVKRETSESPVTVARAVRGGNFYTGYNANASGVLEKGATFNFPGGEVKVMASMSDANVTEGESYHYYPVITATTPSFNALGATTVQSTYGGLQENGHLSKVTITVDNQTTDADWSTDYQDYGADITLSSTSHDGRAPGIYRLWRVTPDGKTTLLNDLEDRYGGDIENPKWATDYEPLKHFDPGHTITVHDIFRLSKTYTSPVVTYIARMYTTDAIESEDAPARRARAALVPTYGISETQEVIPFEGVTTGLNTISSVAGAPVGVTYYNLTGVGSTRPHAGMNIVVTRYSDGTTRVAKELR